VATRSLRPVLGRTRAWRLLVVIPPRRALDFPIMPTSRHADHNTPTPTRLVPEKWSGSRLVCRRVVRLDAENDSLPTTSGNSL
jgi:hypothetical protein